MPQDINFYQYSLFAFMASYGSIKDQESLSKNNMKETYDKYHSRKQQLLNAGWHVLISSENIPEVAAAAKPHGYYGVAYWRHHQGNLEIVISHRGTKLSERGNIIADLAIAQRKAPEILTQAALPFAQYIMEKYASPSTVITHTGFSLGGFLAAGCAVRTDNSRVTAINIDGPGADYLLNKTENARQRVVNYLTPNPSLVNTCNQHLGEIRRMDIFEIKPELFKPVEFELDMRKQTVRPSQRFASFDLSQPYISPEDEKMRQVQETNKALKEFTHVAKYHDLDEIIEVVKAKNKTLSYTEVLAWPVAENEFIYGPISESSASIVIEDNPLLTSLSFMLNNFERLYNFNALSALLVANNALFTAAWELTKQRDETNMQVGVIHMRHKRDNKIYLDMNEYFKDHPKQALIYMGFMLLINLLPDRSANEQVANNSSGVAAAAASSIQAEPSRRDEASSRHVAASRKITPSPVQQEAEQTKAERISNRPLTPFYAVKPNRRAEQTVARPTTEHALQHDFVPQKFSKRR